MTAVPTAVLRYLRGKARCSESATGRAQKAGPCFIRDRARGASDPPANKKPGLQQRGSEQPRGGREQRRGGAPGRAADARAAVAPWRSGAPSGCGAVHPGCAPDGQRSRPAVPNSPSGEARSQKHAGDVVVHVARAATAQLGPGRVEASLPPQSPDCWAPFYLPPRKSRGEGDWDGMEQGGCQPKGEALRNSRNGLQNGFSPTPLVQGGFCFTHFCPPSEAATS